MSPQLQAVDGALKFIRIHRGHQMASTRMVEPITREFVASIERFAKDNPARYGASRTLGEQP